MLPLRVRSLALTEINLKQSKSNDFIKIFSDQITKADVFRLDTYKFPAFFELTSLTSVVLNSKNCGETLKRLEKCKDLVKIEVDDYELEIPKALSPFKGRLKSLKLRINFDALK